MNKDVLVSIKGLQFDTNGEDGELETINSASYYKKRNHQYLIYDEVLEGFSEPTNNKIKWNDHYVDLTKKGVVNVHMVFEENQKNTTNYQTPFGGIMIGIDTKKIDVSEKENQIKIDINYDLEINYEHFANCRISMDIKNKDAEAPL